MTKGNQLIIRIPHGICFSVLDIQSCVKLACHGGGWNYERSGLVWWCCFTLLALIGVILAQVTLVMTKQLLQFRKQYPDEEAGQVSVAFAARQKGSIKEEQKIKDFIARQVLSNF